MHDDHEQGRRDWLYPGQVVRVHCVPASTMPTTPFGVRLARGAQRDDALPQHVRDMPAVIGTWAERMLRPRADSRH
jgi:hypothetical protein